MHITVDASEWDALTVHMGHGLARVGKGAGPLVRHATVVCEATAVAGAPVRTGFMRANIRSSTHGDGRSAAATGEVTSHAGYSEWVEGGTSRMAPQPFMGPALAAATPVLVSGAAALGAGFLR